MPGESARVNGRKGGRPKGSVGPQTLDKIAARELLRQIVTREMQPLIDAQVSHAKGIKYLVVRDVVGKFTKLTSADMDNPPPGTMEIWEKDPSIQAFSDLMNRALDKPAEQKQQIEISGEFKVTDILNRGRERAAKR